MTDDDADAKVRAQYEAHPYPARDPADEAKRLIVGSPGHVLEIEHYLRRGRRLKRPEVLIAGGGTGDGAIMLAQQLQDRGEGRLTYLDVSAASLAIAEARAQARGLGNITFQQGSLLEVAQIAPGPYDYIDCCGVLHHLEDPLAGLKALTAQLKADGGLGLMLYGELGRTGVYPLQRALARLAPDIGETRELIGQLPDTNWFRRNPHLADHLEGGDAGLYDLLLHSRDRAYTVPQTAALLDDAGLRPTGFITPAQYDPATYLTEEKFRARAAGLPWLEQAALAEELSGAFKTHTFYAVRKDAESSLSGAAEATDLRMVPVWRETDPKRLAAAFAKSPKLSAEISGIDASFELPDAAAALVAQVDGRRNLKQIHGRLRSKNKGLDEIAFKTLFDAVYRVLNGLNLLLLAAP